MKYLKLYEYKEEEPKRFVIEHDHDDDFYVWEVIKKVEKKHRDKEYLIRDVAHYVDGKFEDRTEIIKRGMGSSFVCGAGILLTNVIYQTDILKDAIERVNLLITANNYNL